MLKTLSKCALLGSVGISSFIAGSYLEKRKIFQVDNLPGPIFGSVSAASPLSPVPVESNSNRVSQIMKYGFPGYDNIRSFDDYVLSYDRRTRIAHWVFEHLTRDTIKYGEGVDRSKCDFKADESIHKYFRYKIQQFNIYNKGIINACL